MALTSVTNWPTLYVAGLEVVDAILIDLAVVVGALSDCVALSTCPSCPRITCSECTVRKNSPRCHPLYSFAIPRSLS
jgi:hypothetical protein